jgi:hypothetical protein
LGEIKVKILDRTQSVGLVLLAVGLVTLAGCLKPVPHPVRSKASNATGSANDTTLASNDGGFTNSTWLPNSTQLARDASPDDRSWVRTPPESTAGVDEQPAPPEPTAVAAVTVLPPGVKLAPLPLELPAPAFRGTPVPLTEPNVEPPRGKPREAFLAPEGTVNLALGKMVTSSDPAPTTGELDLITDGDKEATDFGCLELHAGTEWVQVDLGQKSTIWAVVLWHNHAQARVYRDVVIQVSDDPDFLESYTVFNNDYDNSSGLGTGNSRGTLDMGYVETSEGGLIDCGGIEGRYVRLYSRGNTMDEENHYTEVEVYGVPKE